jgi:hypothetical protein
LHYTDNDEDLVAFFFRKIKASEASLSVQTPSAEMILPEVENTNLT